MMRSLYSAVSGLKNHQIKMDVIGNNIANVNTAGFKRSRVTFATMLGQTLKAAQSPSNLQGGTNAIQVGLGAMLGSVDQVTVQGSAQTTGKETDLMLQGDGFFTLDDNGQTVYTRSGAFGLDKDGYLANTASGARVLGYTWGADDTTPAQWPSAPLWVAPVGYGPVNLSIGASNPADPTFKLDSFNIGQDGVIVGVYSNGVGTMTHKIAQLAVAKFPNSAGLDNLGNSMLTESANSGTPVIKGAGEDGRAIVIPGTLEMSNVDLSSEFTDMIITQRGFQANSRVITVSDTLLQELIDLKRQ